MRTYDVVILETAQRDLQVIYDYISLDSPAAAANLTDRLVDAILSLDRYPARFPIVPRRRAMNRPVRGLTCLSYRVLYIILDRRVFVLRILSGARRIPRSLI